MTANITQSVEIIVKSKDKQPEKCISWRWEPYCMVLIFMKCIFLVNLLTSARNSSSAFIFLLFEEASMFLKKISRSLLIHFIFKMINLSTNLTSQIWHKLVWPWLLSHHTTIYKFQVFTEVIYLKKYQFTTIS